MYAYIFISLVTLYFLIGFLRGALCWPAIRFEMQHQDQTWILHPVLSYLIYSSAWIMWWNEYKDKRISSRLARLSGKTRNNS